jgi:transglutaminase-like putative cysteine protease
VAAVSDAPLTVTPRKRPALAGPVASPALARLAAFVPLALFGGLHWAALLDPDAGARALAMVAAAAMAGAALLATPRLRGRAARRVAAGAIVLVLTLIAFVAAGVPVSLLDPRSWGDLAAGLGQGISSMPGVSVPYRGVDEWVRTAIMLGGMLLIGASALTAWWPVRDERGVPGFPLAAAVVLGILYGVPVVENGPGEPFLDGAVFCFLLGAFVWVERLRSDQLGVGAGCLLVAASAGLIVAPLLDGPRPWFDYESFAAHLEPQVAEQFSWNHRYGPLDWPRDGREVLRIRAHSAAYWKAANLDEFDGVRWRASGSIPPVQPDTEVARGHKEWHQTIRVVLRNLSSTQFIGAGTTERILPPAPRVPVMDAPGAFVTGGQALRPGQSYRAQVYTPRPTELQLRTAGNTYPDFTTDYLSMQLPASAGGASPIDPSTGAPAAGPMTVRFPAFGTGGAPLAEYPSGYVGRDPGASLVLGSGYARDYQLAQRLRAQASGPYDLVVRIRDRVQQGAVYSEAPAAHRLPLDAFLFDDRRGYCQQFSGAMALLLRMAGVPVRIASGFTPGSLDRKRDEFVVRDVDAHSWVEVYFPRYGWITFDPTPSIAPARAHASALNIPTAAIPAGTGAGAAGDRPGDPGSPAAARAPQGGGPDRNLLVGGGVLLALILAGLGVLARRGRLPGPPVAPELAELQRALHRSGRTPAPEVTLARLEAVLGGSDASAGYVQALRERRYGTRAGGPTAAERRALRHELGAGLGLLGRLRALWALPPQIRHRRPYTQR